MARSWQGGGVTSCGPGSCAPEAPSLGAGVLSASPGDPAGPPPALWAVLVSWEPAARGGRCTGRTAPRPRGPGGSAGGRWGPRLRRSCVARLGKARPRGLFFFCFLFFFFAVQFLTSCVPVSGGGDAAVGCSQNRKLRNEGFDWLSGAREEAPASSFPRKTCPSL